MSDIKVTKERIDHLMDTAEFEVSTLFDKCTVVVAKLENGFILSESSGCVDPANYDAELGERLCKERIRERLWELEGYALQKAVHSQECHKCDGKYTLTQRMKNVTAEILTCKKCGEMSVAWLRQENTEDITPERSSQ